jgi:hypothetical protein
VNDVEEAWAECSASEFSLTHGGSTDNYNVDITDISLLYFSGEDFPSGVSYIFARNNVANTDSVAIAASAVCCPR